MVYDFCPNADAVVISSSKARLVILFVMIGFCIGVVLRPTRLVTSGFVLQRMEVVKCSAGWRRLANLLVITYSSITLIGSIPGEPNDLAL